MQRYPLRAQHLQALQNVVAEKGVRQIARASGCSKEELDEVMTGTWPTTFTRQKVIGYLVRTHQSKHRGDPYKPDGTEAILSGAQKRSLAASGALPDAD